MSVTFNGHTATSYRGPFHILTSDYQGAHGKTESSSKGLRDLVLRRSGGEDRIQSRQELAIPREVGLPFVPVIHRAGGRTKPFVNIHGHDYFLVNK